MNPVLNRPLSEAFAGVFMRYHDVTLVVLADYNYMSAIQTGKFLLLPGTKASERSQTDMQA